MLARGRITSTQLLPDSVCTMCSCAAAVPADQPKSPQTAPEQVSGDQLSEQQHLERFHAEFADCSACFKGGTGGEAKSTPNGSLAGCDFACLHGADVELHHVCS